jgi:hypothetical protein
MKRRAVVLGMGTAVAAPRLVFAAKKEDDQADVRKDADQALAAVYKLQPSARKAVQSAAGYAAFSNFGMKILVAGSGTGKGVAVNNKTKAVTYMRMAELQAGIGFGVKKFQLLWVFDTEDALNKFINSGWEIGAQATASAKSGEKGAPTRARSACRPACGCTRSAATASPSSSLPRAPSTTRIRTSIEGCRGSAQHFAGRRFADQPFRVVLEQEACFHCPVGRFAHGIDVALVAAVALFQ